MSGCINIQVLCGHICLHMHVTGGPSTHSIAIVQRCICKGPHCARAISADASLLWSSTEKYKTHCKTAGADALKSCKQQATRSRPLHSSRQTGVSATVLNHQLLTPGAIKAATLAAKVPVFLVCKCQLVCGSCRHLSAVRKTVCNDQQMGVDSLSQVC